MGPDEQLGSTGLLFVLSRMHQVDWVDSWIHAQGRW